jgi:hypothetical protein
MYFYFTEIKYTNNLYCYKYYNNYSQNQALDYQITQVLQDINLKQ